jgi:hypothetical protein
VLRGHLVCLAFPKARGGSSVLGGAGAGLGGALFVAQSANVTVSNVTLTGNNATGGSDAANTTNNAGGGGGMGGNGSDGNPGNGGGGGLGVGANGTSGPPLHRPESRPARLLGGMARPAAPAAATAVAVADRPTAAVAPEAAVSAAATAYAGTGTLRVNW